MSELLPAALEVIDHAWDNSVIAPHLSQARNNLLQWLRQHVRSDLAARDVHPSALERAASDIVYIDPLFHHLVGSTFPDDTDAVRESLRDRSIPVAEAERHCHELMQRAVVELADALTSHMQNLRTWRPSETETTPLRIEE